jgi:hypothetical protein
LRLNALFLALHTPLSPILPAFYLPAFAALHSLAVRPLVALDAFALTVNPALRAICALRARPLRAFHARRFALHPGLRALRARLGSFRAAAKLSAAAVPGIRTRGRPLRGRPFLGAAAFPFGFVLWPLCEAYGGSTE